VIAILWPRSLFRFGINKGVWDNLAALEEAGFTVARPIPFGAAEIQRFLPKLCHVHTCVFWCSEVGFRELGACNVAAYVGGTRISSCVSS
jgi:hypothetical protein